MSSADADVSVAQRRMICGVQTSVTPSSVALRLHSTARHHSGERAQAVVRDAIRLRFREATLAVRLHLLIAQHRQGVDDVGFPHATTSHEQLGRHVRRRRTGRRPLATGFLCSLPLSARHPRERA